MNPAVLLFSLSICAASAADEGLVADWFEPRSRLEMMPEPTKHGKVDRVGTHWRITGDSPLQLQCSPVTGEKWAPYDHRLAGLRVTSDGRDIATIGCMLQNSKPTDRSDHAVGFCIAPSGEKTTLGFPFPVQEDRYKGPEPFKGLLGQSSTKPK